MIPFVTVRHLGGLARTIGERRQSLVRVANAWCRNSTLADDLVQETLFKALRNIGQLRDRESMDAWLFQIMSNCWRDHFRRERNVEEIGAYAEDSALICEDNHHGNEIVSRVRTAVLRLPVGQREVLALVDLQGFSYDEVSRILEIPVGTVTSRICRAREALRVVLSDLVHRDAQTSPQSLRKSG